MRILYLNHNVAWSGGTFFRALPCATHLAARGHDVTLLAISPARRWGTSVTTHKGVRVIETPDLLWGRGRTGWDPWDTLCRARLVGQSRDWDIVHSWDCRPVAILPALYAHRLTSSSKLLTDWADWWGRGGTQGERQGGWMRVIWPLETWFEETFRNRANGATTISSVLCDRVVGLGVPRQRTLILPQGCEPVLSVGRAEARARLGIASGTEVLVYVGRLIRSDAALLFAAVADLLARRARCVFYLVGQHGADVPAALSAQPRFRVTGRVESAVLADFVAACDLSLVPLADTLASRARWPSKVNGFLAAGRAVVVTARGDLSALLHETGAGVVSEPTAAAVVEAAERVLDNQKLREETEVAARRLAEGALSWTSIVERLDAFYRCL